MPDTRTLHVSAPAANRDNELPLRSADDQFLGWVSFEEARALLDKGMAEPLGGRRHTQALRLYAGVNLAESIENSIEKVMQADINAHKDHYIRSKKQARTRSGQMGRIVRTVHLH